MEEMLVWLHNHLCERVEENQETFLLKRSIKWRNRGLVLETFFDGFQMKLSIKWGSKFRPLMSTNLAVRGKVVTITAVFFFIHCLFYMVEGLNVHGSNMRHARLLPTQLANKSNSSFCKDVSAFCISETFVITLGNISEGTFSSNHSYL